VGLCDPDVVTADTVRTSYFARNAGARRGSAPWLLFLDADVVPQPGLLDALFTPPPGDAVAVLAGAVRDAAPAPGAGWAARFAWAKASMSQEPLVAPGPWAFAQTANAAFRRAAFEAVGGFRPAVRSGGDADICWRLRDAGWALESRPDAVVVHVSRARLGALLAQRVRHGTGAGWLASRYPGALPARRWPGLLRWGAARALAGVRAAARGDRDAAIVGLLDGPAVWAYELGRHLPNRPLGRRWCRASKDAGR
jgi:GT2 family glycosyltransferase